MTLVASKPVATNRRTFSVRFTIGLLLFLGATALGGGIAMVFGLGGGEMMLPEEWLGFVPLVDTWLVPGLVLGIGFGLGSLITAYGMWKRPAWRWLAGVENLTGFHWSWLAAIVIGASHVAWILLEIIWLPAMTWLQAIYGPVGLLIFLLPFTSAVREHLDVE